MKITLTSIFIFLIISVFAQDSVYTFSVNEAQQFALQHNTNVMNAKLDVLAAKKKVWETTAIGLPQVSGSFDYQYIPGDIPTIDFGQGQDMLYQHIFNSLEDLGYPTPDYLQPLTQPGEPIALGVKSSATYSVSVSQLIFSGEYIVGLQAARTYKMLSQTSLVKNENDIKENIALSYYTILVLEKNSALLDTSVTNLQDIYNETKAIAEKGFLDEINADQIKVTLNSVRNTRDILKKQVEISRKLFKIQLGLDIENKVVLSDNLDDNLNLENCKSLLIQQFNLKENVDYKLLETQEKLMDLSVKRQKSTFLPSVAGFYLYQDKTEKADFDFTINHIVGLSVSVPIFSSGQKLSKVSQAKIELEKARNTKINVSESLLMGVDQAKYELETTISKYETQKENVELAYKIYTNTVKKYKEGMASSMDVSQAHSQYIESNSNYTSTILELLSAKIKLQNLLNQL